MANGDTNFKRVTCSVVIAVLIGWLGWVSLGAIAADKRITVVESVVTFIQADITEMKGLVREIRQDQLRRERRENGNGR
jgi:hypothetical protein